MGVVVMHLPARVLNHLKLATIDVEREDQITKRLLRRLLRQDRGPAITTYRFDGPRATIVEYAARYGGR